ncbi:hypothetical protein CapIbe_010777 [Capra ibex]
MVRLLFVLAAAGGAQRGARVRQFSSPLLLLAKKRCRSAALDPGEAEINDPQLPEGRKQDNTKKFNSIAFKFCHNESAQRIPQSLCPFSKFQILRDHNEKPKTEGLRATSRNYREWRPGQSHPIPVLVWREKRAGGWDEV